MEEQKGKRELVAITFDVAVTVESNDNQSKDAGLHIKVLEATVSKESGTKTIGESRVSFSVPVTLPYTIVNNA